MAYVNNITLTTIYLLLDAKEQMRLSIPCYSIRLFKDCAYVTVLKGYFQRKHLRVRRN